MLLDVCEGAYDYYDGFTTSNRAGSEDQVRLKSAYEGEAISCPVNAIPAEAYELRTWALPQLQHQATDFMATDLLSDCQSGESVLQPMLWMSVSKAPPKRFYRTFWRSTARRILQAEREKDHQQDS